MEQMEEELCPICQVVPLTAWQKQVLHGEAKHAICLNCHFRLRADYKKKPLCPFCRREICNFVPTTWQCVQCLEKHSFSECGGNSVMDRCLFHCNIQDIRGDIAWECYACFGELCEKCSVYCEDEKPCSHQSLCLDFLFKQD